MAKGLDKHMERKNIVTSFGKDLARRSKSTCELCGTKNVKLSVYEVPPVEEEPVFENCLFLCDDCIKILSNMKKAQENELRFLGDSMWSEVPLVKATSIYMIEQIKDRYHWANEMLENAYLDEETTEILSRIK